MYTEIIFVLTGILTVMFSWFNTSVVYEYGKLFGLGRYFKDYESVPNLTLPQYLYVKKEKITNGNILGIFYIKLITCPVCLGFWLCLGGTYFLSNFLMVFPLYITTLFLYGLLNKLFT
jgi:hypothetical protein